MDHMWWYHEHLGLFWATTRTNFHFFCGTYREKSVCACKGKTNLKRNLTLLIKQLFAIKMRKNVSVPRIGRATPFLNCQWYACKNHIESFPVWWFCHENRLNWLKNASCLLNNWPPLTQLNVSLGVCYQLLWCLTSPCKS